MFDDSVCHPCRSADHNKLWSIAFFRMKRELMESKRETGMDGWKMLSGPTWAATTQWNIVTERSTGNTVATEYVLSLIHI